jgi:hypothetical protein
MVEARHHTSVTTMNIPSKLSKSEWYIVIMKEQEVAFMITYGERIPVISWHASAPDHRRLSLHPPTIPAVPIRGRHLHRYPSSAYIDIRSLRVIHNYVHTT